MFSETRAALVDFMERSGKSQRQISRETGLSQSVISQFLNGCYAGDNEEVAKSINQYFKDAFLPRALQHARGSFYMSLCAPAQ